MVAEKGTLGIVSPARPSRFAGSGGHNLISGSGGILQIRLLVMIFVINLRLLKLIIPP